MFIYLKRLIFLFLFCFFISSCGGSISNNQIKKMSLFDFTSNEDSPLELITVDGTTFKLTNISGNLVRNGTSNTIIIGETKYEQIILSKNLTDYVTIIPEGNLINGSFGLIGLKNEQFSLPTGKHIYTGNAEVFINDGNALYGLKGNSQIIFDYDGTNTVITGEIKSLNGNKSLLDLSCRNCPATEIVEVLFPSGQICNNDRICFSEIELKNSKLDNILTNEYILESDGSFFGPEGAEFGNVFSVNDTDNGSIEIRGAIVGSK